MKLIEAGSPYRYSGFRRWATETVRLVRPCRARRAGWGANATVTLPVGTVVEVHGMGHDGINCTCPADGGAYDLLGSPRTEAVSQ